MIIDIEDHLKSCPWCGAKPTVVKIDFNKTYIICENKGCAIHPNTDIFNRNIEAEVAKIIEQWNTRGG